MDHGGWPVRARMRGRGRECDWADVDRQSDGRQWMQYVQKQPATRVEVLRLQEALDRKLEERQARETGICPVREDLFEQAFDELIRQV